MINGSVRIHHPCLSRCRLPRALCRYRVHMIAEGDFKRCKVIPFDGPRGRQMRHDVCSASQRSAGGAWLNGREALFFSDATTSLAKLIWDTSLPRWRVGFRQGYVISTASNVRAHPYMYCGSSLRCGIPALARNRASASSGTASYTAAWCSNLDGVVRAGTVDPVGGK